MKKISVMLCVVLVLGILAGCGGGGAPSGSASVPQASSSQPGKYGSDADYAAVIEGAQDPELAGVEFYTPTTETDTGKHDMIFYEGGALDESVMEKYAIVAPNIITLSYGVMIILPKQGEQQAVLDQVNAYVEQQKNAMQNYLQDQYEIASSAIVKTAPTGEVLLAMCKDPEGVMDKMLEGLAA